MSVAIEHVTAPSATPVTSGAGRVRIKSLAEPTARDDGHRVYVDMTIPAGARRRHSRIDEWARDLAPSEQLQRWAANNPDNPDFSARYLVELKRARPRLIELRRRLRTQSVTLLTHPDDASRDHAVLLGRILATGRARREPGRSGN